MVDFKFDKLVDESQEKIDTLNGVISNLEDNMESEINRIKEKHLVVIGEKKSFLEEFKQELYDFECNIVKYSKFNKENFFKIILLLINLVEGKEFGCTEQKTFLNNNLDYPDYVIKFAPRIFNKITDEDIINGNILLINYDPNDYMKDSFYYYKIKSKKHWEGLTPDNYVRLSGVNHTCRKHFSYVYDFIDYMIDYKINNEIDDLSYDEMFKLLKEYVPTIMELIENKYRVLEQADLEAVKRKQDERRQHLKRILEK